MFTLLSSITITNLIYLILGKLLLKKNINNLKVYSEISLYGFIYFSFFALIINFFTALNPIINTLVIFVIILTYIFKKKRFVKKELVFLILTIFFCFFVILFDTVYRPDAGLYHLPFIKILNEEKIIFGLSNLHARFGHISIIQYSSALNNNLLVGDTGILLPLLSIYCFLTFYFIGDVLNLFLKKNNINYNFVSVFFSSMVLLYVSYKINRYSEFGNDAIGHMLYFYLISKLINYKEINYLNFKKIYLIAVFTILNKFTLIFSLLIPVYLFFKNRISLKRSLISLPTVLLFVWILRNLITSGCALYPQLNTCFVDLKWSNKEQVIVESESAEAWAKDWPNRIEKKITMKEYSKNFNWLSSWINNHFQKIVKILLPYLLILIFINFYFKHQSQKINNPYFNSNSLLLLLIVSLIGSLVFFLKFPIYRYGYSYIISLIILFSIFLIKNFDEHKIKKLSTVILIVFLISFIFKQSQRYVKYHKVRPAIPKIYNDKEKYKVMNLNDNFYYNLTSNLLCMYDVNLCTPYMNNKLIMKKKFGYKIFEPL